VCSEEIAGSSDCEGHVERLSCLIHEVSSTFKDSERRVPFIEVANFRSDAERAKQPPTADAE
jgi:hypothetical protein